VENQFFFTTVAGLALSLAGFSGIIAALGKEPEGLSPIQLWRIRSIVRSALLPAAISLALIPTFAMTGSVSTTVRLGALGLIAVHLTDLVVNRRPSPPEVWPTRRQHRTFLIVGLLHVGLSVVNLWLVSTGLLQLALLLSLGLPASIFGNFVAGLGRHSPAD
jgi:hypothetical protein